TSIPGGPGRARARLPSSRCASFGPGGLATRVPAPAHQSLRTAPAACQATGRVPGRRPPGRRLPGCAAPPPRPAAARVLPRWGPGGGDQLILGGVATGRHGPVVPGDAATPY